MLLGTTFVPLVLQNTTQLLPTRAVDSVCQSSTIVLSVSSTVITAADDTVSTSYTIFPVDHYTSEASGLSTTISQLSTETTGSHNDPHSPDIATNTLSFSDSSMIQSRGQSSSESSPYFVFSPTLTSASHIIGGMSLSTTSLSASLYSFGSSLSSQTGSSAPTGTLNGLTFVPQSSMSTVTEQATTATASSTSSATAMANSVYTCPRDNGMYYSDTTNRVYQLLCNTGEPDATIRTTYQPQLQSCVDACSDVEGCIGVSYTATSGSCSYKSSASDLVSSETSDSAIATDYICPGADGTRLVDTTGSVYEILCNTVFPTSSNISSSLAVSNLASCSEICSGIDDCSGFTFQDGSCTTVSSRNSNDGVTRMNVETAILLAKRVVQVVSSGIAPYRSTSFVQSLPVDISRTPSTSLQYVSATVAASSGTVQKPGGTDAVTLTISSANAAPTTSTLALPPSSADVLPLSSGAESSFTLSSNAAQDQPASSTILSNPVTASTITISGTLVVPTAILTSSGTFGPSISIDSSTSASIHSLTTNDLSTITSRSPEGPTVVLSSTLLSASLSFSSFTTSRAEAPTNTALLPSGSLVITRSGESVILRPTLATSQTSSLVVGDSSSVGPSPITLLSEGTPSSDVVLFSTVSPVPYSTVSAVSYFAAPSSLPPETNYSCPEANGEQVRANTGGSYTIGCNEETTGYNALVATASDFNDCMTYCDQLPGCTAWTYSGSCYLKTGTSASNFSFQPSSRGAVSGIRAVPAATNSGLPWSSPTDFVTSSSTSQATGSAEPNDGELGISATASATLPSSVLSFAEGSTTIVFTQASSIQSSEDLPRSTSDRGITTQLPSSVVDTSSDLASEITAAAITSEFGATSGATASDIGSTAVGGDSAASLSYITSTIFPASVTNIIIPATTASTPSLTDPMSASIAIASPSTTCSVFDNLLDICLDAVITPSVGIGGAVSVGLGSITVVDASTSVGIALSAAASANLGISAGTGGVEIGASASIGVSAGIDGSQQPTITTSVPSSSCSAGGNAFDICVDVAITPSIGIGGNAGIAAGSSTITLFDVSASLAIAPTLAAGVGIGISTGSSEIALVASATLEANLGLSSGILPNNTAPTTTANCSAGGNVLNVCVDATITASANAGLNLNLGPSSSALTLLDASVALAPSVAAGVDVGLSVGSSGIGLSASATLGVNLGLSAGLNLGGSQPTANSALATSSTAMTPIINLLPTSSLASAAGLSIGLGQSTASLALATSSAISNTIINLLPTSSLASATGLGLGLGQSTASSALAAGLNLGSGQSTASSALAASSFVPTTVIILLPTSSPGLATVTGLGSSQLTASSALAGLSTASIPNLNLLPTSSLTSTTGLGSNLGQSSSTALAASSPITTININLLPTPSLLSATGLGISLSQTASSPTSSLSLAVAGLGQSSSSASSTSSTSSRSSSVSTTTTTNPTSTSTRASTTPNLVQSLTAIVGRQVTYPIDSPKRRQGFTTLVR